MITSTHPGSFADVTSHNGELYVAVMHDDVIVCKLDGATLVEMNRFPCGGNGFARIKSAQGSLWLIYRPQSGQAIVLINLSTNARRDYTGTFYNWPVCLGNNGYAINYGGAAGPTTIYNYDGAVECDLPTGTPTGLARVNDDNHGVVTIDDNRGTEAAQWQLINPEYAGDVFCGEPLDGCKPGAQGCIPMVYQNRTKIILNDGPAAFVPKITQHGDTWAVATTDYVTASLMSDIRVSDFETVTEPPVPPTEPPTETVISLKPGQTLIVKGVA